MHRKFFHSDKKGQIMILERKHLDFWLACSASFFVLLLSCTMQAEAKGNIRLAVLELDARGLDATLAESVTGLVVREVDRTGVFDTISMDDIKVMLEHEQNKLAVGCDDASCLAEIGGALGVEILLSGSVNKIGQTYVLSLKLIDVRKAVVINRQERTVPGKPDDLIDAARSAVRMLVRPLLKQAEGTLRVSCSEEGAEVYVDDLMLGTTPIEARKLPGGYHVLKVKKESFVAFSMDVFVGPSKKTDIMVTLVPSPEFVRQYESKASTYRSLAWVFTAVSVAAAGSASGLLVWNDSRLGDYNQDRQRLLDEGVGDAQELNSRADSINAVDTATWVVGGVAMVSLGTALYFWISGDPPGRYREPPKVPEESEKKVSLDVSPTPVSGGMVMTGILRF